MCGRDSTTTRGRCTDRLGSAGRAFPDHTAAKIFVAQLARRLAIGVEHLERAVDMVGQQPRRNGIGADGGTLVDRGFGRVVGGVEQAKL